MRRRGLMSGGKIKDYLKLTAHSSGTFTFSIPASVSPSDLPYIAYSINGLTWTTVNNVANQAVTITTPTRAKNRYVLIKSEAKRTAIADSDGDSTRISSTCDFDVSGNILSLLLGDNFEDDTTIDYYDSNEHNYMFARLFKQARIVHADELKLPITGVPYYCFRDTFRECTIMTLGPIKIPITKVAESGLRGMFGYCYTLTNMLDISSISGSLNLGINAFHYTFEKCYVMECYNPIDLISVGKGGLFRGAFIECSNLTNTPIRRLECDTMEDSCFQLAFKDASKLKTSPIIVCSASGKYAVDQCFSGCGSLNYITFLLTGRLTYSTSFTRSVSTTGIFVKHIDAVWTNTGDSGVPTNWTTIYYDPNTNKYYLSDKITECDDHGNVINA